MSREIRKINKGWQHPKYDNGNYQPMSDFCEHNCNCEFCSFADEERMPKIEGPFDYVLYEGVSEGTPLTPPFAEKEDLIKYLVNEGDFWGDKWSEKSARNVVMDEYAPSAIFSYGVMKSSNEIE
jgi:hypothetical protein